jgi:hypothetical protein
MITLRLLQTWAGATATVVSRRAAVVLPHLPAAASRCSELAGLACAGVFLQQVWPPLVWAAAGAVLITAGQRR